MGLGLLLLACVSEANLVSGPVDPPRTTDETGADTGAETGAPAEPPPKFEGGRAIPVIPDDDRRVYDQRIHELRLRLDADAFAALEAEPRIDVAGELTADDDPTVYPVAVRLKGEASFRPLDSKPAFKVDFHGIDEEGRFHGVKRLNLNNMVQDPTMLHEFAYYWLCARLGIPAPRQAYARVWLNDDELGLYSIVENQDEQLVRRVWPDDADGTLFEGAGNDLTDVHDDFSLEEGTDTGALAALVAEVEATPRDGWYALIQARFDADALFAYLALDLVAGNPDGYALHRNNFYLYHAAIADRWTLLPSGVDRSFSGTEGIPEPDDASLQGVLLKGCLRDEACRAPLHERIAATLDAWEALELRARVAEMEAIVGPLCQADPRRDRECRSDEMLGAIDLRVEIMRRALE